MNILFYFQVRVRGKQEKICQKAFLALHGITKSRLERLQKHLSNGNNTAPIDQRGKHANRPNKVPDEVVAQVRQHILSFPRYRSHYSRKDNLHRYYLSPLLSVSKMYELYLQKYEPNQYELVKNDQKSCPIVKYEFYRKYFAEHFKISFGRPKSDTCQRCDRLLNKISAADSDAEKSALEREKSLHLLKSQCFYSDLKTFTEAAKRDSTKEVLTFDFQQNMPLPVHSSGDVFYKIQLWFFNFCIHVGSDQRSYFYVYDETVGGKGQNEVASFLSHFINTYLRPEVTDLYIFSDNCSSQNKNYMLVQYFYTLVNTGRFKSIYHRYPEPGHSFLPCDRSFGLIELRKKKYDKIYLPRDYINIIQDSSKSFKVIPVTQDMLINFRDHFKPFFVLNPSKKNNKFTISKYRIIHYEKNATTTTVKCSETAGSPIFFTFDIRNKKTSETPSLPTNEKLLYRQRRKLKQKKFDHVMSLAKAYVSPNDFWFYQDIERFHQSFQEADNVTSVSEFSSDE